MSDLLKSQAIQSIMFEHFADRLSAVEVIHTHESGCELRTIYHLRTDHTPDVSEVADLVERRIADRVTAAFTASFGD
jgi:hypothetical protein